MNNKDTVLHDLKEIADKLVELRDACDILYKNVLKILDNGKD